MRENKFKYIIKANGEVKISKAYELKEIEELGFIDDLLESLDECTVMCHDSSNCDCDTPFYSDGEVIAKSEYAGYNDVNKTEVYEGDIVEYSKYLSPLSFDKVLVIKWRKSGFWFWDATLEEWHDSFCSDSNRIRIIGNIYESPELLEDKKSYHEEACFLAGIN